MHLSESFSAVAGPNGSRKSNVINPMLFVFGKQAKQVAKAHNADIHCVDWNRHNEKFAGAVEGSVGLPGVLSVSAKPATPDNVGTRNLDVFMPVRAQRVFDFLSVRNQLENAGLEVDVEDGECWEKGPESVMMEGSSIHAVFPPLSHGASRTASGECGTVKAVQEIPNAVGRKEGFLLGCLIDFQKAYDWRKRITITLFVEGKRVRSEEFDMEPTAQKNLERVISQKAMQMSNSFPCKIWIWGFFCGVCITYLLLVALSPFQILESGFVYSSTSAVIERNSSLMNLGIWTRVAGCSRMLFKVQENRKRCRAHSVRFTQTAQMSKFGACCTWNISCRSTYVLQAIMLVTNWLRR